MNMLLAIIFVIQTIGTPTAVGTPIADGTLVVSNQGLDFPELPEGSMATPINEDWELLYYEVAATSREYIVRGEIRNTSQNPLDTPTLIVTFADGAQLGIHPDVDQVGPGERAPFQRSIAGGDFAAALNQSSEIKFSGVCEFYDVIPNQEFEWNFENVEIEYDVRRSAVRVSGTVTNVGDISVERYAPMLFGFTADGQYVGSIAARDVPQTIFSGDQFDFEMDHGFETYSSNEPFSGAGRDAIFILGMSMPVYASVNCVG